MTQLLKTEPRIKVKNNVFLQNTHMQKWPVVTEKHMKYSQELMGTNLVSHRTMYDYRNTSAIQAIVTTYIKQHSCH